MTCNLLVLLREMKPDIGEMFMLDESVAVTDRDNVTAELLQAFLDPDVDRDWRSFFARK